MSGQRHAPAVSPPRKELSPPIEQRLGGPRSRFGLPREKKTLALASGYRVFFLGTQWPGREADDCRPYAVMAFTGTAIESV